MRDQDRGLYNKYTVIDNSNGQTVDRPTFVLSPAQDPAALRALKTYRDYTTNKKLARDISEWIDNISKDFVVHKIKVQGDLIVGPGHIVPFSVLRQRWVDSVGKSQSDGTIVTKVEDVSPEEIEVIVKIPRSLSSKFNKSGHTVGFSMNGISRDSSH
ncbi:carbamoylphosphate synthase [Bacillus phage SP-15]|uniref:Carbamoylphosphate synthase n=1 Tax=Bacillus phage SP-15 TaxID=1792032 RepID=A0A127AWN8_9CAUD|nr:sulfatase-modifying factor enzyme [Bacillus phage SP-15]AMM45002.1 carbamoylphosphate synthase [Bacillus phage SP-15]